MSSVQIREFDIGNYGAVVALWKEAGLVFRPGDDLDGIRLKLERDPDLFLLAKDESGVVGTVMGGWDGRRGWIYHLAVKPSHRRRGIAKQLLLELEIRLMAKGAKRVNAQIYQSNVASLRLFRECGYEERTDLVMIGKGVGK